MDRLTTWLELAGALLLVLAVALFVAPFSLPGAVGCAGLLMICLSALLVRRARPRRRPGEETA